MAKIPISKLPQASSVAANNELPIVQSGVTKKALIEDVGKEVNTTQQYSDLNTTDKTPIGAINEVNSQFSNISGKKVTFDNEDTDLEATNTEDAIKEVNSKVNEKADASSLAEVATSGSYNDLTDKPTIPEQVQSDWNEADNTKPDYIKNKPNLSTVATSGSYNDLLDKPSIPAAQVNSDWNANSGVAQILNKPTIPTVNYDSEPTAGHGTGYTVTSAGIKVIADEVENIRIGADGTTYASAGDAVRDQITAVTNVVDNLPTSKYSSIYNTQNAYLDTNGIKQTQVGWSISDYLEIGMTARYYLKTSVTSNAVYSCFYDKNKNFISSFQTTRVGNNFIENTNNARYVRFSIQTADENDFSYISNIGIAYQKESLSTPTIISGLKLVNDLSDAVISGYKYNTSGVIEASANWSITGLLPVKEGDLIQIVDARYLYAINFDANKSFVSYKETTGVAQYVEFVVDSGVSYIGLNIVTANLPNYKCFINGLQIGNDYEVDWLVSNSSIWRNKTYISHGDSITWQDGKAYTQGLHVGEIARGYQTVFKEKTKLKTYDNQGKSGWSMAVVGGNGVVNTILGVADYSIYNLCTIACGTNDFKLNVPLGTLGQIGDTTFDDTTFFGAYRKAVEYILTSSPLIRLVLMTPLQRDNDGYDVNYTNSAGCKLVDYANAIKDIGAMYGLPVCDMYEESGFTKKTLNTFTMDGLHPNDVGYERMGNYLTGFLNSIGT